MNLFGLLRICLVKGFLGLLGQLVVGIQRRRHRIGVHGIRDAGKDILVFQLRRHKLQILHGRVQRILLCLRVAKDALQHVGVDSAGFQRVIAGGIGLALGRVLVLLTHLGDLVGQLRLVADFAGDAGRAVHGVIRVQIRAVAIDRELPAHDLTVAHSPARGANAGERLAAGGLVSYGVHPAGHIVVVELTKIMAVLVLVIVNLAGFRSNIVCNMCFGLLRIIDMSQIEAVLHRTLRQIVIVRSGQFLAVVTLVLLASMQQLVAVLVLLNNQVGNDLACLRVLRHGDERRLDQIAQTQRVRVHRHSDRDVLDRHGRHSAHAVDSVVECGIDRILHGLVDLGLRTASRFRLCNRNTVLAVFILGQDFLPVCRAVIILIQTGQRRVELLERHLAILGIRTLRACPLGIDMQIRVRDHRAFPQGGAILVRVPAGEGVARLGRLWDGDGAPRGAGDRGHVGAAVGVEGHGVAFGLQIERAVGAKVHRDPVSRGGSRGDGGGAGLTAGSAADVERVSGIQQRPGAAVVAHDVGAGTAAAVYNRIDFTVTTDTCVHNVDKRRFNCAVRCPNVA